ncbi:Alcohol dehydrogenase [NADP(+)] [Cryptotermes secundus]|uniref:Alcohol dehydrogenase [NADP(+)] n=1 Tax=Cryptotermes secundus TaxID=105785 RepID=A0A2J7QCW6_9NEOP|nr:aldo-keto reductase family 1 member A1 [Cryptotermes secundus]PNF26431.1 Alcohol dehydrogenase [NADP(+)] [Cryptotermes secundus]
MASLLKLRTGASMPAIGFGTWQASDSELEAALDAALEAGYRHIDTAYVYENEAAIGRVLAKWLNSGKVQREDLFIVTKLPPTGNHPDRVEKYLKRSLDKLGLDYVDIYLVHVPFGFLEKDEEIHPLDADGNILLDKSTNHVDIWKAMEVQVDAGRTKAIGLSNFNISQIKRVLQSAHIPPANLQVELHVLCQQRELVDFCKEHDIIVCAYSPLGSRGTAQLYKAVGISKDFPDLMNNSTVLEIAKQHAKTPAQILLRHIVQRGMAAIPKSTNSERIRQNLQVHDFELSSEDMASLDKLDQGSAGRILDFGFFKGIKNHPEYPFQQ